MRSRCSVSEVWAILRASSMMILERIFNKDSEEATRIMLNVHHDGQGVAGTYTREIAETKVVTVHRLAKKSRFPLRCSLERDT